MRRPCTRAQVLKLAKKAAKRKQIKRGVKEVIKAIRKNTKGCVPANAAPAAHRSVRSPSLLTPPSCSRPGTRSVCIIAGDISPIDVITPLPVLCEDNDVPYIYVPSKEELGQAGLTKRPTSCMLILPKPLKGELPSDEEGKEYAEAYEEVYKKVKAAQVVF